MNYYRTRRRAVTLIEVMLVLALLVLIAAAAWPALERSMASQRLKNAADIVRAEWAHTRAKAMLTDTAYQFCYTPDGQTFWVEPCEGFQDTLDASAATETDKAKKSDDMLLPDKILFVQGKVQAEATDADSPDQADEQAAADADAVEDGEQDAPIIFYPDGTCSSASLVLKNEYEHGIKVTIRGLTAISTIGEIFNVEDGLP